MDSNPTKSDPDLTGGKTLIVQSVCFHQHHTPLSTHVIQHRIWVKPGYFTWTNATCNWVTQTNRPGLNPDVRSCEIVHKTEDYDRVTVEVFYMYALQCFGYEKLYK